MKWIVIAGLAGWAGIVWLAWTLANERIGLGCAYTHCDPKLIAQRDAVLTNGLTVALVALIAVAVLALVRSERLKRGGANQAQRPTRLP